KDFPGRAGHSLSRDATRHPHPRTPSLSNASANCRVASGFGSPAPRYTMKPFCPSPLRRANRSTMRFMRRDNPVAIAAAQVASATEKARYGIIFTIDRVGLIGVRVQIDIPRNGQGHCMSEPFLLG